MKPSKIAITLAILFSLVFSVYDAQAYLDLGTGSYILQLILAGLFATLFTAKMFWKRMKSFLKGLSQVEKHEKDKD